MGNQVKALLVVIGLTAFCVVPVAGPILGDAAGEVVRRVFGVTPEAKTANIKRRVDPRYAKTKGKEGPLRIASECCAECDGEWDFGEDRCTAVSRATQTCYLKCNSK